MHTNVFMTMLQALDRHPAEPPATLAPQAEACFAWAARAAFGDRRVAIKVWGLAFARLIGRKEPCDDQSHGRGPNDECLACAYEAVRSALKRVAGHRPHAWSAMPYGGALVDGFLREVAADVAREALWATRDPYEDAYLREVAEMRQQREWEELRGPVRALRRTRRPASVPERPVEGPEGLCDGLRTVSRG